MDVLELTINKQALPVIIYSEKRRGYRASFTKKGLVIRIPKHFTKKQEEETIQQMIAWAENAIKKQPALLSKYLDKEFKNGDQLSLFDQTYTLVFHTIQQKTITGKVNNQEIHIYFPLETKEKKVEPQFLSKILAKHYKAFFKSRVEYWNACFPVKHQNMRLKYNSSNWGSCSSKGNINLSTRLLMCPLPVIDYVIVHELSHLIHQNHSRRFWNEVARVLPDYKVHHNWLKTLGSNLDFKPNSKQQPQP